MNAMLWTNEGEKRLKVGAKPCIEACPEQWSSHLMNKWGDVLISSGAQTGSQSQKSISYFTVKPHEQSNDCLSLH